MQLYAVLWGIDDLQHQGPAKRNRYAYQSDRHGQRPALGSCGRRKRLYQLTVVQYGCNGEAGQAAGASLSDSCRIVASRSATWMIPASEERRDGSVQCGGLSLCGGLNSSNAANGESLGQSVAHICISPAPVQLLPLNLSTNSVQDSGSARLPYSAPSEQCAVLGAHTPPKLTEPILAHPDVRQADRLLFSRHCR